MDGYFWSMIGLAFIMSFSIGSNETDALAMAYSSGAMNMFSCVKIEMLNSIAFLWLDFRIHWGLFLFKTGVRHTNY